MEKHLAGLMGVMSALTAPMPTQHPAAATLSDGSMEITSYADLLKPIPNAIEKLRVLNVLRAQERLHTSQGREPQILMVQYYHHHHHHAQYYYAPPAYVAPYYQYPYYAQPYYAPPYFAGPRYHHHHHHHHHQYYSPWR